MRTREDLRGYQRRSVKFMHKRRYGALLIDMGLGKTIIALTAIVDLIRAGLIDSVLLVGPIRVIEGVWRQEAKEWAHTRKLVFSKVHGNPQERAAALKKPAHIYMINPEGLKWLRATMGRKPWPWDMLLVDESTEFAEPNTVRFKSLRRGLRFFKRRYVMTGTPTPRSLLQIWSQMFIADLGASLGQRYGDYKKNNFHKTGYMGYKLEPNDGAEEIITEAVSQRVVRLDAADWLELPELITTPIWVDLPPQAMRLYRQMEEEMFLAFDTHAFDGGEEAVSETAATLSNKCRQIANGAIYTSNIETGAKSWRPLHDAKLDALREIVDETQGNNILVPYQFKHDAARIAAMFPKFKMFDKKKTELLLAQWNHQRIPGLILHPANASYGLNMQKGGHIFAWFGATFSLRHYLQMIGRLLRSGQTHAVMNYIILARGTVDEIVLDALTNHEDRQNRINAAFGRYYKRRLEERGGAY